MRTKIIDLICKLLRVETLTSVRACVKEITDELEDAKEWRDLANYRAMDAEARAKSFEDLAAANLDRVMKHLDDIPVVEKEFRVQPRTYTEHAVLPVHYTADAKVHSFPMASRTCTGITVDAMATIYIDDNEGRDFAVAGLAKAIHEMDMIALMTKAIERWRSSGGSQARSKSF